VRLLSVELEGIKSYAERTRIDLEPGVNALVGHNGAGKSTVLEAIGAALFNYLPYQRHEDFVRRGVASGRVAVRLLSGLDERCYEVVRIVGKNGAWYVYDPELGVREAEGERPVTAWLREHLELAPGTPLPMLFLDSVGPPQGTFTAPFLDTPTDRKKRFDRLLRVAEYQEAWLQLREVAQEFERRRLEAEARLAELRGETARLPMAREAREAAAAQAAALEALCQELERRQREAELLVSRLDLALTRVHEAQRVHASRQSDLASARERLETARAAMAEAERAAELVAASRAGAEAYQEALTVVRAQEQRRKERDALQQRLRQAQEREQRCTAELAAVEQRLAAAEADAERLHALLPKVSEQEAAERERDQALRRVSELEGQQPALEELRLELSRAEQEKAEAEQDLRERRVAAREAQELLSVQRELEQLRLELQQLTQRAEQLRQATLAREQAQVRLEAHAQEEAAILADLARLEALRPLAETLPAREAAVRELAGRYQAAETALATARETRARVEGGLCPFLIEPCKNVAEKGEGLTLESYFDSQIALAAEAVAASRAMLDEAQALLDQAAAAQRQLQDEAGALARLALAREQRQAAERERDEAQRLERELADAPERLHAAQERAAALEQALPALQRAAERAGGLDAAQRSLQAATQRLWQTRSRLERLERELERLPELRQQLQEAERRREQLGDVRGIVAELRRRAEEAPALQECATQLREEQAALASAVERLALELAPFADVDERLACAYAARDRYQPDYETFVANQALAAMLDDRRDTCRRHEELVERQQELAEQAARELAAAEAAYDPEQHEAARRDSADLANRLGAARSDLQHARETLSSLDMEIQQLQVKEQERVRCEAEIAELAEAGSLVERMRGHIRAAGPRIAQTKLQRLSELASKLFGEILGDATARLEWAGDYEVILHQRGHRRSFRQLSGGEQMCAALAIRLALLKETSEVRIAFLDEPTTNMDDTRRANLARQLAALKGFEQMVVISHDDTFDGLYGHVLRVAKVDGASQVEDAG